MFDNLIYKNFIINKTNNKLYKYNYVIYNVTYN